jgi:hypothetical protein
VTGRVNKTKEHVEMVHRIVGELGPEYFAEFCASGQFGCSSGRRTQIWLLLLVTSRLGDLSQLKSASRIFVPRVDDELQLDWDEGITSRPSASRYTLSILALVVLGEPHGRVFYATPKRMVSASDPFVSQSALVRLSQ